MLKSPSELPERQVTPAPPHCYLRLQAAGDCRGGSVQGWRDPIYCAGRGLYSSQLNEWRRELAADGVERLAKSAPGSAPKTIPEQ